MARPCQRRPGRFSRGFTLIELLVAISILALMAVLSWRGLDGMAQTQSRLQQRADEVLALQAGLAQWGADLDALVVLAGQPALDWDGRALRLTRSASAAAGSAGALGAAGAVTVIAWSRREIQGIGQWLRWQSPPLQTRAELQTAWAAAAQWAQNPGDDLKAREVRIVPLAQWQIFYFRNDAWTNPLSAAGSAAATAPAGTSGGSGVAGGAAGGAASAVAGAVASAMAALAASLPGSNADAAIPQGVRLVLTLPPGQAISGSLTRDWVLPTLGGGKS